MLKLADQLRTNKEKIYGVLMLVFGALLWVLIARAIRAGLTSDNPRTVGITWVYVGYAVAIGIFYFLSSAFYRATAFGNMILLGPQQFPELHAMVVAAATELGMSEPPKTFLYNSNGLFNAFARRLLGGRYVFLTSALVEANNDEQVRFVIGHELGHHAAGHQSMDERYQITGCSGSIPETGLFASAGVHMRQDRSLSVQGRDSFT